MHFSLYYILLSSLFGAALLFGVNAFRTVRGQHSRWREFSWSTTHYYLYLLPLVLPLVLWLALYPDREQAYFFIACAVLGVIGESGFSLYWNTFFREPFWHYFVHTIWGQYTSLLNFIPWAIGGVLYLGVARLAGFEPHIEELSAFWIIFSSSLAALIVARLIWKTMHRRGSVRFRHEGAIPYLIVLLPILAAIGGTDYFFPDARILEAAAFFGLGAWVVEYFFGKGIVFFLGKRLWAYNYMATDNGHITPLSILPFALAGFWFMTVYYLVISIA